MTIAGMETCRIYLGTTNTPAAVLSLRPDAVVAGDGLVSPLFLHNFLAKNEASPC